MSVSFFIWYKVAGDPAEVRDRVTAMQIDLADATGVVGRLLTRADDSRTWMEIYEDVDDPVAFERALAAAVAEHRVERLAGDGRHVERFRPSGELTD